MNATYYNGQAASFVQSMGSQESQAKTTDQLFWLTNSVACFQKTYENYKLLKFWDGSVLRMTDNVIGVVDIENWTKNKGEVV